MALVFDSQGSASVFLKHILRKTLIVKMTFHAPLHEKQGVEMEWLHISWHWHAKLWQVSLVKRFADCLHFSSHTRQRNRLAESYNVFICEPQFGSPVHFIRWSTASADTSEKTDKILQDCLDILQLAMKLSILLLFNHLLFFLSSSSW